MALQLHSFINCDHLYLDDILVLVTSIAMEPLR